jgi:hypothetical protein
MALTDSILRSVKKNLGLAESDDSFDQDVLTHINSVFADLNQLGLGPANGFMIEGSEETWDSYLGGDPNLSSVKSYVYLRVRLLFDPPTTSYLVTAMEKQIEKAEWRLNVAREAVAWVVAGGEPGLILDGGVIE